MKVSRVGRMTSSVTMVLTAIAAASMIAMMVLTAADVALRYLFNRPIPGALEMVEYLMAIIVPFSISYCALHKSHVAVDLVADRFPKTLQRFCHYLVTIPSIGFILFISWQNYLYIFETYDSQMTSAVLKIPAYPFVIPVCLGMLVFGVIMLVNLFSSRTREAFHGTD